MNDQSTVNLDRTTSVMRWILAPPVPCVLLIINIANEDSFAWSTGPYGAFFAAWIFGYGIWASITIYGRALRESPLDFSVEKTELQKQAARSLEAYRGAPGATYELLVAFLALAVAYILPEKGFLILIWTLIHILFVVVGHRMKAPHDSPTTSTTPEESTVE